MRTIFIPRFSLTVKKVLPYTHSLDPLIGEKKTARGFTLIELVIVIALMGAVLVLAGIKLGTFSYWREEGFIRSLSDSLVFLHTQAIADQATYRMEFDLDHDEFRVGVMKSLSDLNPDLAAIAADAGNLTLELAAVRSPALTDEETMIPPPSFPSLAEPHPLPKGMSFEEIKTARGRFLKRDGGKAYILFSPRGFSDFCAIHLKLSTGGEVTVLVNPFSGSTEIFREYKDFDPTYGKDAKSTL